MVDLSALDWLQYPLTSEGHYVSTADNKFVCETFMEAAPLIAAVLNDAHYARQAKKDSNAR